MLPLVFAHALRISCGQLPYADYMVRTGLPEDIHGSVTTDRPAHMILAFANSLTTCSNKRKTHLFPYYIEFSPE